MIKAHKEYNSAITRHQTVYELVNATFEKYANKPAFTCFGETLSFREVEMRSARFASYLRNVLQLEQGDRVAIQLPNILQFPVAMYGLVKAGLVAINVNPLYTPRELKHQLNDSGAKVLLVLSNVADHAAEIIEDTCVEHVIVTDVGDELPAPKRQIINFSVKYLKRMVPKFSFKNAVSYREISAHTTATFSIDTPKPDSLLVLQYTGGTTGVAKGAMLTHGNLASNVWQMKQHLPEAFLSFKEVYVACLPLYHIYAYNLHGLCAFSTGGQNILIPNPRDFKAMVAALKNVPFSVLVGINTLFRGLIRCDAFKRLDFSHLKVTSAGGMALTEDAAVGWHKITGCKVIEGYGLTETSPVLTGNYFDDIRLGYIGAALPETELKIVNDEGKEVAVGEVGELWVRGPQVMKGYWNMDAETKNVMTDEGFFKTGDIARCTDDGFYQIVDRKKDMILVSGFNVYPNEVEEILCLHPDIIEAAVVGVPDQEKGEAVKAFIVREQQELTEEEVMDYCRDQLTGYKVPQYIEFRSELPKSNVGKILRRSLRDN